MKYFNILNIHDDCADTIVGYLKTDREVSNLQVRSVSAVLDQCVVSFYTKNNPYDLRHLVNSYRIVDLKYIESQLINDFGRVRYAGGKQTINLSNTCPKNTTGLSKLNQNESDCYSMMVTAIKSTSSK